MGKRCAGGVAVETHRHDTPISRPIRKRRRNTTAAAYAKTLRLSAANYWHDNDDEDSSSNDAKTQHTPNSAARHQSSKQANNSSILVNSSLNTSVNTSTVESPKPVYTLRPSLVNGTIFYDITRKPWRLGRPIGKGNFGEIFLASDNITIPVTNENAKFVVKIEPHSNGPLFVEIHCLINTAKKDSDDNDDDHNLHGTLLKKPPTGIPDYIASGSHYFGGARYRFLVLQRFDRDLHSLIKNNRVHQKSVLTLAIQIVNVLENLHDRGYCHNDVKAQNLMLSKCKYCNQQQTTTHTKSLRTMKYDEHYDEKQQTTDSGNSSEQEANYDDDDADFVVKRKMYNDDDDYDEDFDDGTTSHSITSNSMDICETTPLTKNRKRRGRNTVVEYSGSNPVRSCRRKPHTSIYDEMVKSHYLRPSKRVSYSEFFVEDGLSVKEEACEWLPETSDDESEEFLPQSARRSNKKISTYEPKRITRREEKKNIARERNAATAAAAPATHEMVVVEEERIFLIDFGLASKFNERGVHRPFVMDQRRAHDGTLEFTSRDAHMGAHSRRSDLECLGYNLIFWSQGYLPWKEAATQNQQEKVHQAKEYLMTDVREMLKQIYGKQVPKYLGEFLHHIGQLAYHERPDYARYRRIFEREFQQLGYSLSDMRLNSNEIVRTCLRVKEEIENKKDIFEMNKYNENVSSIMKNMSNGTPFHERTSNRVSPKNLRSKSDKKSMKKKKFSWAEILSQDPDQIARERAEKEFDREEELSEEQQHEPRRYEGNPTYAILELQERLKLKGRLIYNENDEEEEEEEGDNIEEESDEGEETEATENDAEEEEEEDQESVAMDISDDEETGTDDAEASSDDDENVEEEDDDDDEDMQTDATEASEQLQVNGRSRRTRSKRIVAAKVKSYKSKKLTSKTVTTKSTAANRKNYGKRASAMKSSPKITRGSRTTTKSSTPNNKKKRGSATSARTARKGGLEALQAASEANEIEHNSPKYFESGHGHKNGICNGGRAAGGGIVKPPERRTRRCLIKTDTQVKADESNTSFSPDVRGLFNVWQTFSSHSPIYYRSGVVGNRNCKK